MLRSRKDHPSVGVSMTFCITCFPKLRNKIWKDTKKREQNQDSSLSCIFFGPWALVHLKNSVFWWTATHGIMETNLDISVIQRTYMTNTEKAALHALGWTIFRQYSGCFPETIPIMFFQIDCKYFTHYRIHSLVIFLLHHHHHHIAIIKIMKSCYYIKSLILNI